MDDLTRETLLTLKSVYYLLLELIEQDLHVEDELPQRRAVKEINEILRRWDIREGGQY